MSASTDNLKGLVANPRTRLILIITGILVALMVIFGLALFKKGAQQLPQNQAQVSLGGAPPSIESVPGSTNNPKYAEAAQQENEKQLVKAEQNGGSSLPTPIKLDENASVLGDNKTSLGSVPKLEEKPIPTQPLVTQPLVTQPAQPPIAQVAIVTPNQMPIAPPMITNQNQQYAYTANILPQGGAQLVTGLTNGWAPTGQTMETDYTGATRQTVQSPGNSFGSMPNVNMMNGQTTTTSPNMNTDQTLGTNPLVAKAGTVMSAIMKTGINTDEPGPILAEIVSGPLKGATLIGTVTSSQNQRAESVALQFNVVSPVGASKSYPIQAYAINPDTSRTGLATEVDKHYLERFGLMFASSFIQGYGQAVAQSGSTVTTNAFGGTTVSNPTRTSAEISKIALGQVGQNIGSAIGQNANRPITIHVAQGTAIGVLIMQDLSLK